MHSGSLGSGHSHRASKALQICCNPAICREGQLFAAGFMTEESSTWQVNALTGSQQTGQSLHIHCHLATPDDTSPARLKLLQSPQASVAAVPVGSVQHEREPTTESI